LRTADREGAAVYDTSVEPRIEYATASDGVSIAFWTMGSGIPIVNPPPGTPWSHIEREWQIPEWRHWYEHLMEFGQVIRYDGRGSGLSEHNQECGSIETAILDLDAVVDRLGLQRFALFAIASAGATAIAYAARRPERVSHLILWCAFAGGETRGRPLSEALDSLINVDYALFCETLAHSFFGWEQGESAHRFALYMQDAMSQEEARRQWRSTVADGDVQDLLPRITAPTLVLHRRDLPVVGIDVARRLAAHIPHARLKIIDGSSLSPYIGDVNLAIEPIREFLGVDAAAGAQRRPHPHAGGAAPGGGVSSFRTIMFTDMEGSTALTQRLGDAAAQQLVRLHDSIVSKALASFGGQQVKHTGDGIMASFPTASSAVECAIAIQQAFAEHNDAAPAEPFSVRIGINAGEPVEEGDDLFGTAVQLAKRVCESAGPGEILTSDVVRQLVAGKGFLFAERGEAAMRGFEEPVRIYEVRWRGVPTG